MRRRLRAASSQSASSPWGSRLGQVLRSLSPRATRLARSYSNSPYSSIADVAAAAYWFVPVRALLRDPFRNDLLIGSVSAPTLIVHGTKDAVVPIRFGEKLFALANPPKEFWRVEGGVHLAMGERFADTLDWIARMVPST